ncbi:MAG: diaminopimelate epimerase [Pseudomonadota bacterium]
MDLEFIKMEGIGNDFIIIDDRAQTIEKKKPYPDLARQLCSRHFGIGGDGLLLILPSNDHDFKFRIYNSDGSSAQMCGNGIRCVAKYVYEKKIVPHKKMRVDTLAGTVIPEVFIDDENIVQSVRVDMGQPILMCSQIPFESVNKTAIDEPLVVGDNTYFVTTVSMGNPHAVIFVDDIETIDIKSIGTAIETNERFLEKTNVEFIQVMNKNELRMKVWERGAGITLACGTGACASLVAAKLTGRSERSVVVHLDGGDLDLFWDKENNHVFMEGPVTLTFTGRVRLE